MIKSELIKMLSNLDCGDIDVLVRGEFVVADISDVYVDIDHSNDSKFIAIDLDED